ncbi:MAG: hypothetical protein KDA87_15540 [Planctomycetales bacterium]|nr:hypothetical protein [Planctomycetales bacterium]
MSVWSADDFLVSQGPSSASEVEVFVKATAGALADVLPKSRGRIKGPYVPGSRTIPAAHAFQFDAGRNALVANVLEPCFWSTHMPSAYRVEIQTPDEQEVRFECGLIRIGVRNESFFLNGRRWVFRAVRANSSSSFDLPLLVELHLGVYLQRPSFEFVRLCSQHGVPVMVEWCDADGDINQFIVSYSKLGGVVGFAVNGRWPDADLRSLSPNRLFLTVGKDCDVDVAHGKILDVDVVQEFGDRPTCPVISISRSAADFDTANQVRTACERMQRVLAPRFDLAGYVS